MTTSNAIKWATMAALGLLGVYMVRKTLAAGSAAVDAVGNAAWSVNPLNNDNVIYQTANVPIQWATGNPNATLGGTAYDVTHDGTLNPASANNIIYRNITPGGQSLGSWLYDVFN